MRRIRTIFDSVKGLLLQQHCTLNGSQDGSGLSASPQSLVQTLLKNKTNNYELLHQRVTKRLKHQQQPVIICNASPSMAKKYNHESRLEMLQGTLQQLASDPKFTGIPVFRFSNVANDTELTPDLQFRPYDGRPLHHVLNYLRLNHPDSTKTIFITDGLPNNPPACHHIARMFTNSIHTIYCGSDQNTQAKKFARILAQTTLGHFVSCRDLRFATTNKEIFEAIKFLLARPKRKRFSVRNFLVKANHNF